MYSKEFFVKQFQGLETDALVDRLATQELTDEAREALLCVLDERGLHAQQLDEQVHAARKGQYLRTGVTNQCDFCGKRIGAFKVEGQRFCNIDCFHTSRLRLAAVDVTDEQALDRARKLKAGSCPACRQARRGPDLHKVQFITSMLFVVTTRTETSLKCSGCAVRSGLWAALYCAAFGWWSVSGLFMTPFWIGGNLLGVFTRKSAVEPSSELVDWARMDLAEQILRSTGGGRWSLRP